ncbi:MULTISPECIES: ribosome maturation factor RimM [Desulfosporosinus]|uniref:Ribosome maturation factor RimM n=1 Tax=Desulfosporosinus nitroreducens TaxID=2018668 RepID=A0ABT8QK16_9FIRM|nr:MULTISPECIES: ribosome maturation factor RimM [Desulfosporosinus]MCO1601117.1 ribosome maturation factor RimM [Desulfosporosinus nitroreducens]MCO5385446.1 ribosome maturation factor RimM [Desulfosporosinus sp.]MDA8223720.1 ribosome maturation factor RimM [Desulfitobacterium hafniense]MDO0821621.1 ribosome maturation factor RimM [Desulfosporosinus nitroreducens]
MDEVLIGEVLRPHGLSGELRVYPLTNDPERFLKLQEVILRRGETNQHFKVIKARLQMEFVLLEVEGIDSADQAEKYRGWEVRIDRSDVLPLKEGWYYFELEGMQVYEGDLLLGTLSQVLETGANDVYVVKGANGELCIPALKSVVQNVDVPGRRMDVILPAGLRD